MWSENSPVALSLTLMRLFEQASHKLLKGLGLEDAGSYAYSPPTRITV